MTARASFRLKRTHEKAVGGIACGVDEVGRGPLAGPVIAAAIILPQRLPRALAGAINDSKKLQPAMREKLAAALSEIAIFAVGEASVEEIDTINILQASLIAMKRAVAALSVQPEHALVDGNQRPALTIPVRLVIGGDGIELSIAAASIIAKVHRDTHMARLHDEHPAYGWADNAGYATRRHCAALRAHGVTPHHRRSFTRIREIIDAPSLPFMAELHEATA